VHAPLAVGWLLVALCAASGGYCVLRTRSGVPAQRATARGEALMGFGMAAMAVPAAVLAPPGWVWLGYAAVFGAATLVVCAALLVRRGGTAHHLHHLIGMLAMVYMACAMAAVPGGMSGGHADMAGMSGMVEPAGWPVVTGVLLVYFAGYVLWAGARLVPGAVPAAAVAGGGGAAAGGAREAAVGITGGGSAGRAGARWGERPELALACRLSMGTAMVAMLLTL
jgi:hypothetical protein